MYLIKDEYKNELRMTMTQYVIFPCKNAIFIFISQPVMRPPVVDPSAGCTAEVLAN